MSATLPRKRTARACDTCRSRRTRCDGALPCQRCREYQSQCLYTGEIKKRGRRATVPQMNFANNPPDGSVYDGEPDQPPRSASRNQIVPEEIAPEEDARSTESIREPTPAGAFFPFSPYPRVRPDSLSPANQTPPLEGSAFAPPYSPTSGAPHQQSSVHATDRSSRYSGGQFTPCRYKCLEPLLPYLGNILSAPLACDLLEAYFVEPGSSFFRCASPFVLTPILRKKSLLHHSSPRPTSLALLSAMLWCSALTADSVDLLHIPGARSRITTALYDLSVSFISEKDPDSWRRTHGGLRSEGNSSFAKNASPPAQRPFDEVTEKTNSSDDVLTLALLSIGVSGGDFKRDSLKWWSKAVRLAFTLGLNKEIMQFDELATIGTDPSYYVQPYEEIERQEERRRIFWLLYCLDRHLALSFNVALSIPDFACEMFVPMPEKMWENLETIPLTELTRRRYGPPQTATGTGFFEYFLPMMAILGDIIDNHHRAHNPRLGKLDDQQTVAAIHEALTRYENSLHTLSSPDSSMQSVAEATRETNRLCLVGAYGTHITHVLLVLLYGKWDVILMLNCDDDWITSPRFERCATHAIAASEAVQDILVHDPELTFMPYLFGIYLLHGSFILLLFADRMPQVGLNESVERACETLIRAHEVSVATLSTDFQRNFRRVLRSTLNSVRKQGGGSGVGDQEELQASRRILELYRWTRGAKGLAL